MSLDRAKFSFGCISNKTILIYLSWLFIISQEILQMHAACKTKAAYHSTLYFKTILFPLYTFACECTFPKSNSREFS